MKLVFNYMYMFWHIGETTGSTSVKHPPNLPLEHEVGPMDCKPRTIN